MDTAGEKGVWDELGDWERRIHTAKITEENLLFHTGNTTQCSVVTQMGYRSKKERMYEHTQVIHCAVQKKHNIVKQLHSDKSLKKESTVICFYMSSVLICFASFDHDWSNTIF